MRQREEGSDKREVIGVRGGIRDSEVDSWMEGAL